MMIRHIFLVGAISFVMSVTAATLVVYFSNEIRDPESAAVINAHQEISQTPEVVADMIERVNGAVVSISVTKDVPVYEEYLESIEGFSWFGGGFAIPRIRERGTEEREVGGGSGFIVSPEGVLVTNRHVVSDETARYSALLNDGTSYEVEILARDTQLDIAVLKIKNEDGVVFDHVAFGDSDTLRLGQTVVAIGNALGEFRNSVSVGVVSGLARSVTAANDRGGLEALEQVIQTDAAINPGNSGGPLLNLKGEVIGVNVATTRGADNIAFALPADAVSLIVSSVAEYGEIVRPFLGVRYKMLTPELALELQASSTFGALILNDASGQGAVVPGSPADIIGLRAGDIILALDGEELSNTDLATVLRTKPIGSMIEIEYARGGVKQTVSVKLIKAPTVY